MKCKNEECENDTEKKSYGNSYKLYCCDKCRNKSRAAIAAKTRINNRPADWLGNNICQRDGCKNTTYINKKGKYTKYCSVGCRKIGVLASLINTNLQQHGVKNAAASDEVKNKIKSTFIEKYGCHPMSIPENYKKVEMTNIKKYGTKSAFSLDETKKKIKETNIEKYGYDNPSKSEVIKNKIRNINFEKFGAPAKTASHISKDSLNILKNREEFEDFFKNKSIRECAAELGVTPRTIGLKLRKYGIHVSPCNTSSFEKSLETFLNTYSINFIKNTKKIISPFELDFFIPDYNFAIECNGSFWHSELNGKDKNYHLNKTIMCKNKEIKLLHIWEHDWINNKKCFESLILSNLNRLLKIPARKCTINTLTIEQYFSFLKENHIQGAIPSPFRYGLFFNDELVSVMGFTKSTYCKNSWELIRFCNKLGLTVVGGASKLFKEFIKTIKLGTIVSYCHVDKFSGCIYKKLGFTYTYTSAPNCYYTKDYVTFKNELNRQNNNQFTNSTMIDSTLVECSSMKNHGYDRIWDCGSDVWVFKISNNI